MQLQNMPLEYAVLYDSQDIAEVLYNVGKLIPKTKQKHITAVAVKTCDGEYAGVYYTTENNPWLLSTRYTKINLNKTKKRE